MIPVLQPDTCYSHCIISLANLPPAEKCDGLKWRSSENCVQVPFSVVHIARRPPHRDFPLHQVWQSESQRGRSPGLDRAVRIYKMEKNEEKDELDGEKTPQHRILTSYEYE